MKKNSCISKCQLEAYPTSQFLTQVLRLNHIISTIHILRKNSAKSQANRLIFLFEHYRPELSSKTDNSDFVPALLYEGFKQHNSFFLKNTVANAIIKITTSMDSKEITIVLKSFPSSLFCKFGWFTCARKLASVRSSVSSVVDWTFSAIDVSPAAFVSLMVGSIVVAVSSPCLIADTLQSAPYVSAQLSDSHTSKSSLIDPQILSPFFRYSYSPLCGFQNNPSSSGVCIPFE